MVIYSRPWNWCYWVSHLSAKCADFMIIPIEFIFYVTVWLIFLNTLYNITSPIYKPSKVPESINNKSRVSWVAFKPPEAASCYPSYPSGQVKSSQSLLISMTSPMFLTTPGLPFCSSCLFLVHLAFRCKSHSTSSQRPGTQEPLKSWHSCSAYSLYHPSRYQAVL